MNATMMLVGLATVGAALPAAGAPAAQAQVDRVAANPSRAGRRLLLEAAKLSVRNQPLKVALQLLGRTSGVPLNYSDYFLPDDLRVSCDCLEVSVGAALERLLASTMLRVVEMKSHVLIEPIDERSRPAPVLALHAAVVVDSPSAFDGAVPPMSDPPQAPVTGTVRDAQTERALPGARLTVVGTSLSATTDAAGRYTIDGVQPGTHRVRAILIGYGAAEQSVTVRAGASTVLDFGLRPLPFQLSEIVTTATGQQNRLELGNTVSTIDAAATVAESPVVSVQDLLNSRATGVSVLSDNGVLGGGHRIRVRGLSSASLSNDPLVYLDGVRIEASAPAPAGGTGGPASLGGPRISLLNDINPEEIESIEVVKGPSAATLYGTEAANGVIRITTKRGLDGRPRWSLYLEQGLSDDVTDYPDAFWSTGPQGRCVPFQQALGLCTIDNVATVNLTKDPQFRPFRTGHRQQYGAQVSGGVSGLRYFLSGEFENESGTLTMPRAEVDRLKAERGVAEIPDDQRNPSELTRASVRGNLSLPLGDDASVTISNGLIRSAVRNPPLGDRVENPLIATVTGVNPNPAASTPYRFVPPSQAFAQRLERNTDRFVNSIQASWTPFEKLSLRSVAGLDYATFSDEAKNLAGQGCASCGLTRQGTRAVNLYTNYRYSAEVGGTLVLPVSRRLESRTSAGLQYNRDKRFGTLNTAFIFPPGALTIDAGAQRSSGETTTEAITVGYFLEEQVSIDERLFLTGALRVDRNSSFGRSSRTALYPKISASWVAISGRQGGALTTLRARAAYGASGLQPPSDAALAFYLPVQSTVNGANVAAVSLGAVGNPDLKPERSAEIEAGVDLGLFADRLNLELTYYHKRTTDALVSRNLPGSLGTVAARFENLGEVENQGVEVALNARVIERPNLHWDLGLRASGNRNRLISLGGVPPIRGFGFAHVEGYPLYGLWNLGLESFDDANGDGIIVPSEIAITDTAVFGGSSVPTRSLSLTTTLSLWGDRLRLGGLVDYRGGHVNQNVGEVFRCSFFSMCEVANDPDASLEEQAKALAGGAAQGAWIEDASFIKLREAYVSLALPARWAGAMGARTASLTLTARNLGIHAPNWSSWDPETNIWSVDGPNSTHSAQSPPRTFLLRLQLGF